RLAGAKRLILVHIPPWGDEEATLAAARAEYDGPIEVGHPGQVIEF
ncbi:MAG TPA: MBL fold metallo-hydrolase, partial [Corynebacterium sp.]|nr:MBL fold metallo-hydrolase [Corynebacterium sp.]